MNGTTDRIHVLHVDDEPGFADMAAEFLEREDDRIFVQTATNVQEGLTVFADSDIDCIVSDHDMPGQNGIEFLETVREKRPELPFILYTGKGSEEVASEAISAGVTDYLQKESGTEQYEILANDIVSSVQKYRSEQKLDDLRRRYTKVVEQNFIGIYIIQHGEFVYVNSRLAEIHGYDDPTEVIGMSPSDLVAPEERDKVQANLERRFTGEVEEIQYQTTGLRKDGERIDIELHGSRIEHDGETAVIGAELDITDHKERERVLTEEKERYSTLVEQSHDAILVIQHGEIKFVNEQAEDILGYEESELLDKPFLEIIASEDRERLQDRYLRRLDPERESPPAQYDLQFRTKQGEERSANISAAKIQFEGEPADLVSARDVTERKRYQSELERVRTRFRTVFEKAPESIAIHDRNGDYLEVNDQLQKKLGYSQDEITSMNITDTARGLTLDEAQDEMERIELGETQKMESVGERKDGSRFPVEIWINKIEIAGDVRFLAFGRDITERKEREQELTRLKRRYETLIEAAPDSVFVADTETGEILEANSAVEDLLGNTRENIVGRKYTAIAPAEDAELYQEVFERAQ
ncbi:MAG: PAS domain S-box protein, partial [Halapricum sp.]